MIVCVYNLKHNEDYDVNIKVNYIEQTDSVVVELPCKWCRKLSCICDDEYERWRDYNDQMQFEREHHIYDSDY